MSFFTRPNPQTFDTSKSYFKVDVTFDLEEWPKNDIHLWTMIERIATNTKLKLEREQRKMSEAGASSGWITPPLIDRGFPIHPIKEWPMRSNNPLRLETGHASVI
jgi:hypothetical protein